MAEHVKAILDTVPGVENAGIFRIKGQPNLEFSVDRQKCKRWNISVKDVENALAVAVGGQAFSQMIEGEKALTSPCWPKHLRGNEQAILDIPVDVSGNQVQAINSPSTPATPTTSAAGGPSPTGTATPPDLAGQRAGRDVQLSGRHAATPASATGLAGQPVNGAAGPAWVYLRPGASTIFREQGKRLIAVKFSVNNQKNDLASAVATAQGRRQAGDRDSARLHDGVERRVPPDGGGRGRLLYIVPISLLAIFVLLYLSFRKDHR